MVEPSTPQALLPNFTVTQAQRASVADALASIASQLSAAETQGSQASGQLGLESAIASVKTASQMLRQARFRIMVLGDLKRGKSTLLNALLGATVLPVDVNPCTALLTTVRASEHIQVTIHYTDDQPPRSLTIEQFKAEFTIAPDEAKKLAEQEETAFPNVSHAVIEHPMTLLPPGVELMDTPGLNDTEARNQLVLNAISEAQAVVFVLSATQPLTLDERRYLQNYLRDRGIPIFFVVNGWDRIANSLVDPEDQDALKAAESRVQELLKTQLTEYCGERYAERVFTVSALQALRRQQQDPGADLQGTGLPEFTRALDYFLRHERTQAEFAHVQRIAQRAYFQVQESVARRIPLLDQDAASLRAKIDAIQGEFAQLRDICDRFAQDIQTTRDAQAQKTADDFRAYLQNLEKTFEADFAATQPELNFGDFVQTDKRATFFREFKRTFERYMNDRLAAWEFMARQDIAAAFTQLNEKGKAYQSAYAEVVEAMNEKLLGGRYYAVGVQEQDYVPWSDRIKELFEAIPETLNDNIRSFSLFWQKVLQWGLIYAAIGISVRLVGILFSSLALNIFGAIAITAGVVAVQAEMMRQNFLKAVKQEFAKQLPKIAQEQWQTIYQAVQKCFDQYQSAVIDRINADIESRQAELENLLEQKETFTLNRDAEVKRLQNLEAAIAAEYKSLTTLTQPFK